MWIKLLSVVGDKQAGAFMDVEETVARSYVAAGLAEEKPEGPEKEMLQKAKAEYLQELTAFAGDVARTFTEARAGLKRPAVIEPVASEADKRKGFGDFVRNVARALDYKNPAEAAKAHENLVKIYEASRSEDAQGGEAVGRGMTEGTGSAGGYLTPVQYETQLLKIAAENSVIYPGAQQVPMGARTVEWPALDQYQVPAAGQTAMYGGVSVYRKTEVAQRTQTQPKLSKIQLNANDLTAFVPIGRDLLQDSTQTVDALATDLVGGAIGWKLDYECFSGTGAGMFLGYLNAPSTISISRNTPAHIKYQDVFTMFTRLLTEGKGRAVWVCHPYTIAELMQIQDPTGKFIMLPYSFAGDSATLGAPFSFKMLGMPVMESEKVPALGNAGDLSLVDRFRYLVGSRSGLEIGMSDQFYFDTDQIAIRAKIRNDGQPQLKKAITLADGSSKVSSAVQLI